MTGVDPLHVACAVVGDYLPHAAAMLRSVLRNGDEPQLHIHLLHDTSVRPGSRAALADSIERPGTTVEFIEIDDARLAGLPTEGFTGKGSWYRIFLPDLLPGVDRLLYFDADLLVVDSLRPLREISLDGAYVAAVTNVFEPWHGERPGELGLAGPDDYFNAGVLLMNLAAMRRDGTSDSLLRYGTTNAADLRWRDQDALNVVLGPGRIHLPPRWNCMNSIVNFPEAIDIFGAGPVEEARRNPAVRHFEGPLFNKPWHYFADPEMQALYRSFRAETPWPHVDLEDRTIVTRAVHRLPLEQAREAYLRVLRFRQRVSRVKRATFAPR